MSSPLAALEQLLALSEAMVGAAGCQDWETLASREAERRALADSLPETLASDLPATEQERARVLIESSLRCDERIRPLVSSRLNELRIVLREPQPDR